MTSRRPARAQSSKGVFMLANNTISAQRVLEADLLIRGRGIPRALRQLERHEPNLAEYVMESATRLYEKFDRACPSHRQARALHSQSVQLVLVSVEAVRRST